MGTSSNQNARSKMKSNKFKIIFVCAENITRSLTAECCLKKYLEDEGIGGIEVSSAGTTGTNNDISDHCFAHFEELEKLGIDLSKHKRTPLTEKMAENADLIVCMSQTHQDWIKENYNINSFLFTEISEGTKRSISVPSPSDPATEPFLRNFVHECYASMPKFVEYVNKMHAQ